MFEAKSILYVYVETPLHVGSGRGLAAVDLPIQRERITGYPMVQASGIKGRLRAETNPQGNLVKPLSQGEWLTIFGPETKNASDYAGSLSVGDARLLLFPVRSLGGVFAWTTSVDALARFQRDAVALGLSLGESTPKAGDAFQTLKPPEANSALITSNSSLLAGGSIVLEEFSFTPDDSQSAALDSTAKWLAKNALPTSGEYQYWRDNLPGKLCVLPENAFRDFTQFATEVQTHIKIDPSTKTVVGTALWTTESLPMDTLLYVPLMATPPRMQEKHRADGQVPFTTASDILKKVCALELSRMHLGGDETTGQGMVALRFGGVK